MSSLPVFGLLLRRRDPTNLEKRPLCVNKEIKKISPCEKARIMVSHTPERKIDCFAVSFFVCFEQAQYSARRAKFRRKSETSHGLLPRMLFLKLQHNQTKPPTLEFAALLSSSLSTLKIPQKYVK